MESSSKITNTDSKSNAYQYLLLRYLLFKKDPCKILQKTASLNGLNYLCSVICNSELKFNTLSKKYQSDFIYILIDILKYQLSVEPAREQVEKFNEIKEQLIKSVKVLSVSSGEFCKLLYELKLFSEFFDLILNLHECDYLYYEDLFIILLNLSKYFSIYHDTIKNSNFKDDLKK